VKRNKHGSRHITGMAVGGVLLAMGLPAAPAFSATPAPRIDLQVLVVSDGGPATEAITAELDGEGTPYTVVDLEQSGRPVIDQAFLSDTVGGLPRAKYQAVVLPNDNPFPTGSAEMAALAAYEKSYAIPQVDAYTYARPQVGLQPATSSGYSGSADGFKAQVTAAGRSTGPFGYLNGSVPFEDNSPSVSESYAFLAQPAAGADFTSYVEAPIPGKTGNGTLVGEYRHDGRRELVVTFAYNRYQEQFRLLSRGIVDWMTQNVRLGASRNYFAVHVDDVFAGDDRWDPNLNCTPGDVDCPPGQGVQDSIRITPDDVKNAVAWEKSRGFTLDLAYNGGGSVEYRENHNGADALADQLALTKGDFRWINHTYDHAFLGCQQNVSVVPWKCTTNPDGSTKYVSQAGISKEISDNQQWAQGVGLPVESDELITGEHSGMKLLPQQPQDNPYLAPALTANKIDWLGADMSRDPEQRQVGSALTVARYPINIFYNAGHVSEQVDEYNWIYTSRTQGGSGLCEDLPNTTCLPAPLSTTTGYTGHIVPLETQVALGHVLGNDPRPHFIHQSNLAEDRIGYPVLDGVLDQYKALYAASAPLVNLRMKDIGAELRGRGAWNTAVKAGQVTGYRIGDSVTVQAPAGVAVTATMPNGTNQVLASGSSAFGQAYAGSVSGWVSPQSGQSSVSLTLAPDPARALAPQSRPAPSAERATPQSAPRTPVPAGVTKPVPYSAERR
jgi:hypothetical protein